MLSTQVGDVTVSIVLWPAIILIVALFALRTIELIVLRKSFIRATLSGNYNKVIKKGKRLLKYIRPTANRGYSFSVQEMNSLLLNVAVAYLATSDKEQFREHITAMNQLEDPKEFWLAIFWLREGDMDAAELHYNNIDCYNEETKTSRIYFESLRDYRQGDCEAAKEKMQSIYQNLHYPLLKSYADEILN